MEKFTTLEKKLFSKFLDELEDCHSNAGCNDYDLPNTPEGREIHQVSVRQAMSKKDAEEYLDIESKGKKICTMDSFVFSYLRKKLERILNELDETV